MQVLRTVHGPALRRGALTLVLLAGVSTAAMAQTVPPPSPSPAASPALSPTALRAASVAAADSPTAPASTPSPSATPSPSTSTPASDPSAMPTSRAAWEGLEFLQAPADKGTLEIYGFGQADAIADFKQNDPKWYDVNRPTKLPSFTDQFGKNGRFYLSPRQSRFGVKADLPTSNGNVKAQFEFDMFGVGGDAGQTTIRLRHAFGEWHNIGAGQTNSQFMDVDVFPNILDYWGPNGMLFFRNTQVYYRIKNDAHLRATVAIEAPGASGDGGIYSDRVEVQNITPRFPMPDLTGNVRYTKNRGYVQAGGIVRRINYDDTLADQFNLSGDVTGWGISLSSNVTATKDDTLRLQYVYGHGIENYFNDAPVDIGIKNNPGNAVTPILGTALPVTGLVVFLDHNWHDKMSSSIGYSLVNISNSDGELPSAFHSGQYFVVNLLSTPVKNVMMGGELQWAHRENKSDGFKSDDVRLQISFKYSFSYKVGG